MQSVKSGDSTVPATYRTKGEIAAHLLREAIIRGDLRPGARLILDDLSRQFDVSLTPIRESLPLLEAEGFTVQSPHKGALVAPMDREDILELYAIRGAMEALATREGVPRLTGDHLAAMAVMLEQLESFSGDWESFLDLDKQFHLTIYRAAGSNRWVGTINTLWLRSTRYMLASTVMRGAVGAIHTDHRALLGACRQHDADRAEALVLKHLAHSRVRLLTDWP